MRSRLALADGKPGQAFDLAKQSLAAARMTPKPIERGMLSFWAFYTGASALAAANRRGEATKWWAAAAQSIPKGIELAPSEQGGLATIELQLGNRASAQRLISTLSAIGYRHPRYLAAIKESAG